MEVRIVHLFSNLNNPHHRWELDISGDVNTVDAPNSSDMWLGRFSLRRLTSHGF